MHPECRLSIITVNYNGLEDTCALIDSITFDDTFEVIVVDNGSATDEAAIIQQRYPQVRAIRSDRNLGFAGGNNIGIRAAKGEYLYLINNDTLLYIGDEKPASNGFQPLIDRLDSQPQTAIVCPKIRFAWGSNPIQYVGYTPLSAVTMRNCSIGFGEEDRGQYDAPRSTPYAHGAAMMLRRSAIDSVGLMPECYFLYYEELDWSEMFLRAGYDIWVEPASTIYHKESQSTGQSSPLKTYYITRNRLLFAQRNMHGAALLLSYAYQIAVVAMRDLLKYALSRRFDLAKATLRGITDFLKLKH